LVYKIKEVTLFQSGIGFFRGQSDQQSFILPVNENAINDVLKSFSIEGLKSITFNTAEDKALVHERLGISINKNQALFSLCEHLIGLNVTIKTSEGEVTGIVMGIDFILLDDSDEDVEIGQDVLLIKENARIKSIPFSHIQNISLLDESLKQDLNVYLNLEATTRKQGVIDLQVETDEQDVSMNWMIPVTAWRLSYRLNFFSETGTTSITGLAIVDNITNIDWEDVILQLMTGKPVSFRYNLHSPFLIDRPVVPRVEQGLSPFIDETSFHTLRERSRAAPQRYGLSDRKESAEQPKKDWDFTETFADKTTKLAAKGIQRGGAECFQLKDPITINRNESALIPLFIENYKGKLSVIIREDRINEAMDCLLLDEPLSLEQGVATITIDDSYSGEAMVVRGADYIPFRINQEISCLTNIVNETTMVQLEIRDNLLVREYIDTVTLEIDFKNNADDSQEVLLELNKRANFEPAIDPTKETENYVQYQFVLDVGTTSKNYEFRRKYSKSIYLRNLEFDTIIDLLEYEDLLSWGDERKLKHLLEHLTELAEKEQALEKINEQISFEYRNQKRLRENIKVFQKINNEEDRRQYLSFLEGSEKLLGHLLRERKQLERQIEKLREKI
jgi:hypothetical protein